ncbi:hypothetical protein J4450_08140 [Candidatus Micrarchaeota archaeon]|nr:hypothetical protein [Candidatus Micrarchaeota archaeon]
MVESSDGKVRLNLTLESLFETKREELRKMIYQKLFEQKQEVISIKQEAGSNLPVASGKKPTAKSQLQKKKKKVNIDEAT